METLLGVLIFLLPTQLSFHLWPNWAFVFGVRVDYFAPTLYLTDILITLLIFCFLKQYFREALSFIKKHYFYLSAFLFFCFTNIYASTNVYISIYKWLKIVEFLLFVFVIVKVKFDFAKHIFIPLSLSTILISIIGILQFIKGGSIGGPFYFLGERLFFISTPGISKFYVFGSEFLRPYSIFSHPNSLAGYILVSLLLMILFRVENKLQTIIRILAIFLGLIILALTYSLNVYLTVVILAVTFFLIRSSGNITSSIFHLIIFSLFFLSILSTVIPITLIELFINTPEVYQRLWLTIASGHMYASAPIFGVGEGNYILNLSKVPIPPDIVWRLQPVHNIFLLVLSEVGIPGFLLTMFILFKLVVRVSENLSSTGKKNKGSSFLVLLPLMAILITGFSDHYSLTLQQNFLIFAVVIGLVLKFGKKDKAF